MSKLNKKLRNKRKNRKNKRARRSAKKKQIKKAKRQSKKAKKSKSKNKKQSKKLTKKQIRAKKIAKHNNGKSTRTMALIIGLLVNIFGNSLTIVSGMGAEPWTSAAVGLSKIFSFMTVGHFIIVFGVMGAILNQILLSQSKKIDLIKPHSFKDLSKAFHEMGHNVVHTFTQPVRFLAELVYIFVFGDAVDIFTNIMTKLGLQKWGYVPRIIMAIAGVTLFCIAISIYQRANIFMHPNDDTSNLLRFKLLGGSAIASQVVDIIPALIFIIISFLVLRLMYGTWVPVDFGIGTVYSVVANGFIVKYSDKWVWPSLVHNKKQNKFF